MYTRLFRLFVIGILLFSLLVPTNTRSILANENESSNETSNDTSMTSMSEEVFTPQVIAEHGFENNNRHGWVARGGAGAAIVNNETAHSGASSMKMTERTEGWHMARLEATDLLEPGAKYELEVYVKLEEGTEPTDMELVMLSRQPEKESVIQTKQVGGTDWVQLKGEYLYDEASTQGYVYLYARNNPTANYYVDDFKLTKIAPPPATPELGVYRYNFDDGTTQGWSPRGGVNLIPTQESVVSSTYSLKTTGRTEGWHGPSLNVKGLLKKDASYEISASVKLPDKTDADASSVKLTMEQKPVGGSTGYPTIASASVTHTGWMQLKGSYSFAEDMDSITLYIESSGAKDVILIDDVVIRMMSDVPADQSGMTTDFENGTSQGWYARIGSETLTVAEGTAKSGNYSLLTSTREGTYFGPGLNVLGKIHKESRYKLSAWVKLAPGESPTQLRLSLQRSYQGQNHYDTIVGNTDVTDGEWVQLTGDYQLRNTSDALQVYVESGSGASSFYLDDFSLTYIPPIGIETDIPSLHEQLSAHFPSGIGTAIEPFEIEGLHGELLKKHFNSVVTGNEMKPDHLQPQEGNFTFNNADKIVAFAKDNGMTVRGHTLVWHNQTPSWFFKDVNGNEMVDEIDPIKREANKELLLNRLETHIKTVVEHYGTDVYAYDVVNEVIDDAGGLRKSKWYLITGDEFIKEAFRYARQYAPAGTKLYINDYNTHSPRKAQDLYDLVTELLAEGVPIDGVGHQSHVRIDSPTIKQIGDSIERFGQLGLDNQITELDMTVYSNDTDKYDAVPEKLLIQQGYRYKELMDEFIRLKPYISSVIFWGMGDDNTWLKNFPIARLDLPLLFDEQLQAKPAFWGIVDPSKLPVLIQQHEASRGKPVINKKEELLWEVQKEVKISSDKVNAAFKLLWDTNKLYVIVDVEDDTKNENGDIIELFIDDNHAKTTSYEADDKRYILTRSGKAKGIAYKVNERKGGYTIEASLPITNSIQGSVKGFDIRITDGDQQGAIASWSDLSSSQNSDTSKFGDVTLGKAVSIYEAEPAKGKVIIDGQEEKIWKKSKELSTELWVQGTSGSTAKAKLLWDKDYLYVLVEVKDQLLSGVSANEYEQDSIELFLDTNNGKTDAYEGDDGQIRINFNNRLSFGGAANADMIQSAVRVVEDGYIAEASIKLPNSSKDRIIGFDLQVNNDEDGNGSRDSVVTWNDPSGNSYRNTSKFGAIHFSK